MSLFKHALVSGINDGLVDNGIAVWPNEKVAFEVCSKIAADLDGPDVLPEGGIDSDSAVLIAGRLKEASEFLLANGYVPSQDSQIRTKMASEMNFADRAAIVAEACMDKAAAEASLTQVGPNTAESAAQTDQHAALDLHNRAVNEYLTGVGRTRFPNGGIVGQQMVAPGRVMSPAISNSLTALDKQAAEIRLDPTLVDSAADRMSRAMDSQRDMATLVNPTMVDPYKMRSVKNTLGVEQAKALDRMSAIMDAQRAAGPPSRASTLSGLGAASPQALAAAAPQALAAAAPQALAAAAPQALAAAAPEAVAEAAAQATKQPGRIMQYLQSAKKNPFAETGAKNIATALAKHPGTHAALLAGLAGLGAGAYHMMGDDEGREVTASEDLSASDMGADSDEMIRQIMAGEGVGQHASPELIAALNAEMQKESADHEYVAWLAEKIAEEKKFTERVKELASKGKEKVVDYARSAKENPFRKELRDKGFKEVAKAVGKHPGTHLVGAAGLAYGGKKLYDKYKEDKENEKEAAYLEFLAEKYAAEGDKKLSERARELAGAAKKKVVDYALSAKENPFRKELRAKGVMEVAKAVGKHPGTHLVGAAGLAYGGKKLYDKYKGDKEEEKAAALLEYLKAAADGSLTDVGENTEESAAHTDSVAALDLKNRAVNEYLMGVGKTRMPNKGQVYAVEHADQDDPVHTDNLPTNETKSAELAYVQNFRKIASDLGPYLPATMSRDEKVAHLQTMLGLPPSERVEYVQALRAG